MNKPKYYLQNEERLNDRYVFISYSHKDADVVYPVLHRLYELGINFWYDDGLNVGDIWNEKVRDIINNTDCMGALVFLSENTVKSQPVNQEVEIMLGLRKQRGFTIAPIIIGHPTAKHLIFSVSSSDISLFEMINSDEYHIKAIAYDDISCRIEDCTPHIERLANSIDVMEHHTVVVGNTDIDKLPYIKDNERKLYRLGSYPIYKSGEKQPIYWELLCRDDDIVYMISQYCIDFTERNNIQASLNYLKASVGEYETCVQDIIIPDEKFINDNRDKITTTYLTDYAESKRTQLLRCIWIKSADGDGYVLFNTLGTKINECINHEIITAGIRPVILIDNKKIKSSKEIHK